MRTPNKIETRAIAMSKQITRKADKLGEVRVEFRDDEEERHIIIVHRSEGDNNYKVVQKYHAWVPGGIGRIERVEPREAIAETIAYLFDNGYKLVTSL